MKRFKRSKFLEKIGFKYIVNHHENSREIHRVDHLTNRCGINLMTNAGYATALYVWYLTSPIFDGDRYNGCAHCYKEKHTE